MSDPEESQISSPSQKFVAQEGDEEVLWSVIEITAEKPKFYKVRWEGHDPKTMKPWPLSWVPKEDCTDDLVRAWKQKQKDKKKRQSMKKRDSVASKKSAGRESTSSTVTKTGASTVKGGSLRSESIVTVTAKGRPSGSKIALRQEEEGEEEEEEKSVPKPVPAKPKQTISKSKKTGNKRKHAEVSSTHTSANSAVMDVDVGVKEASVPRKIGPPAKKRKITQSSPLKAEVLISPPRPKETIAETIPKVIHRKDGRMTLETRSKPSSDEDDDDDDARQVERQLSSPDHPSDREAIVPPKTNGKSNGKPTSSKNGRTAPRPSKKSIASPQKSSSDVEIEEIERPPSKAAPLSRKNSSKSTIQEGPKRTLTLKRPPVLTSDSDSDEPQSQPQQVLFLRSSSASAASAREHSTPLEERSVFWDGEERETRLAILSPRATHRLKIFEREIREAEEAEQELQRKAARVQQVEAARQAAKKNDSQETVPETEFGSVELQIPPDITPERPEPPSTPPPTRGASTLKAKMQGRTPLSKHSSMNNVHPGGPSKKVLRPIPMLDAEVFHPYLQNSIPETIEEASSQPRKGHKNVADDDEPPLSSIEQFDTPDKTRAKAAARPILQLERIPAKDKGKRKALPVSKEPSASEIWESEVVQRGQQIAAAAKRKEKEREMALNGDSGAAATTSNPKRRTLLDIVQSKTRNPLTVDDRIVEEASEHIQDVQMDDLSTHPIAPSSHPPPPTAPEHDVSLDAMHQFINFGDDEEPPSQTIDPKLLRQEEEESTQDQMADDHAFVEDTPNSNHPTQPPSAGLSQNPVPETQSPGPALVNQVSQSQSHENSQLSYVSQPHIPSSQPISPARSTQRQSPDVETPVPASIPQDQDSYIPISQEPSQEHYGMDESIPHTMELDGAGPSGLDVAIVSQDFAAPHLQLAAERAQWDVEKVSMRAELEATRQSWRSAEKDRDFFREQYARASAFVSDTIEENKALKKQAEIAQGQVKEGVKFVREMYEARTVNLEEDAKHWRNTAQFLIEKDRRTNDEIRRRAAEEPEVRKKLAEEKESVFMRDKRIYDLEKESQEKLAQKDQEIEKWKRQSETLARELAEAKHKLERIAREGADEDDDSEGHELLYPCAWRAEGANESCGASFASRAEFEDHVTRAHLPPSN